MMNRSHWVRVFKIPYRKQGHMLTRDENILCETIKNGLHRPGERTHIATDTELVVHIYTPYFDEPKTPDDQADADQLYAQCEREADQYLRTMYPDLSIS
jgi:hypothetical protein